MLMRMHVLALEPYFGGSHEAFLSGWAAHSHHTWTALDLPPRKWKWRMRHAALTLADRVAAQVADGARWDAVVCSDMLNLAEFRGLAPEAVRALPTVVYFHENQITYPFRHRGERDFHFGFTNMTTALAADEVWFNSAYHRDDFLAALRDVLKRMPDFQPLAAVDRIRRRSRIQPPGIHPIDPPPEPPPGPLHILWAARWEHDKNPDDFFAAVTELERRGINFHLSVVGEQFQESPAIFEEARAALAHRIDHWGYQPARSEYVAILRAADVFVSTAGHEFFGLSAVEAMSAGCYPLLPQRLAYPELIAAVDVALRAAHFYDGTVPALVERLVNLAERRTQGSLWGPSGSPLAPQMARFAWSRRGAEMDHRLEQLLAK